MPAWRREFWPPGARAGASYATGAETIGTHPRPERGQIMQ
jgi:hypothetical protein